jgi:hypothetical protein
MFHRSIFRFNTVKCGRLISHEWQVNLVIGSKHFCEDDENSLLRSQFLILESKYSAEWCNESLWTVSVKSFIKSRENETIDCHAIISATNREWRVSPLSLKTSKFWSFQRSGTMEWIFTGKGNPHRLGRFWIFLSGFEKWWRKIRTSLDALTPISFQRWKRFQTDTDHEWAIDTWESLRFE